MKMRWSGPARQFTIGQTTRAHMPFWRLAWPIWVNWQKRVSHSTNVSALGLALPRDGLSYGNTGTRPITNIFLRACARRDCRNEGLSSWPVAYQHRAECRLMAQRRPSPRRASRSAHRPIADIEAGMSVHRRIPDVVRRGAEGPTMTLSRHWWGPAQPSEPQAIALKWAAPASAIDGLQPDQPFPETVPGLTWQPVQRLRAGHPRVLSLSR